MAVATPAPRRDMVPASRWVIAGIVAIGSASSLLSTTVVNVAVSDLQHVFNAPLNDVQWVLTAYLLGLSATIPLSGWATDRFGSKRMYLATLIAFTFASGLCGLAWNISSEVVFRVIQGLAGGMVMPVGMAILMRMTPANERGRMMSFLGVPMMLAPALGPTVGGLLIKLVDWRLIFWINIPFGLLAAYLAWRRMSESERMDPGRFDMIGFLTCTPGVALVIFGLTQAAANGWGSWKTLVPIAAAAALLVFFTLWELRQERPLLDVRIFSNSAFRAASIVGVISAASLFGPAFLAPVFMQQVQGYDTLGAGLLLGVQGLAAAAMMPLSGYLTDRYGAKLVVFFGVLVLVVATVLMTGVSQNTTSLNWILLLGLRGIGMGFAMMPAFSAAYVSLAQNDINRATAMSNTLQRIFSSLGIAVLATVIQARIPAHLPAHVRPTPGLMAAAIGGAFDDSMWVAAATVVLALPASLMLQRAMQPGGRVARSQPVLVAGVLVASLAGFAVCVAQAFGQRLSQLL